MEPSFFKGWFFLGIWLKEGGIRNFFDELDSSF